MGFNSDFKGLKLRGDLISYLKLRGDLISYLKLRGDLISRQYIRDYEPIYSQLFSPALESKHGVTKPTLKLLKA